MKIKSLSSSVMAIAISTFSSGALAQVPDEAQLSDAGATAQQTTDGPIIVTAQKRSESINDVPISMDVMTGADLQQLGVTDTESLARVVPSFVATNTYFGTPVYYLRGVGYLDTAIAARPAVALYANEIPLPFAATALGSMLDLERVEVLKGPQGTFFGSNATGGAINFIAAQPTNELSAGANLSYGRFNEVILGGFVSGPLSNDINARLAFSRETSDDWQRSYTSNAENGSTQITSGRLIIDAEASENLRIQLTASGTVDRSDTIAPQLIGRDPALNPKNPDFFAYPLAPLNDARAADFSDIFPDGNTLQRDDWAWQVSLRADLDISPDVTLTSLSAITRAGIDRGYDADGTTLQVTNLSVQGTVRSLFQELRASIELGDRVNAIVGANYQNDKSDELVTFLLPEGRNGLIFGGLGFPPIDLVPEIAIQESDAWAVFGNVDFELADGLIARAGIRYTKTQTDFSGCALAAGNLSYANGITLILGTPPIASGECATFTPLPGGGFESGLVSNSLSEDNISWRVGLDWQPNDATLIYASVSRGYKAGSFSNISAVFAEQYVPVPQERLTAYELGTKIDLIPDLHVNAAVFYYDYVDKQQQGTAVVPVFGALTALVSIPESHIQGAEFDVEFRPADGLVLNAAATYLDTQVDGTFLGNTAFGPPADFDGTSFPNTPRWQLNGGANYTRPVSGNLDAFVGVHLTYKGDTYSDFIPDPRLYVDDYLLVDAQAGLEAADKQWRFSLWARNLTDKVYTNQVIRRQEALVRTVGMPRTYGASFSIRY